MAEYTGTNGLPQLEPIFGTRIKHLTQDFTAYSDYLKTNITIPKGFYYDEESTPWRGENPLAGLIHDYLSRYDSCPVVTQWQAAMVYKEFQTYEDSLIERKWYTKKWDSLWRYIKAGFVAICPAPIYWHKHSVETSYENMI